MNLNDLLKNIGSGLGQIGNTAGSILSGVTSVANPIMDFLKKNPTLIGGLLTGASATQKEPGEATEARQFLRNQFTSPNAYGQLLGQSVGNTQTALAPILKPTQASTFMSDILKNPQLPSALNTTGTGKSFLEGIVNNPQLPASLNQPSAARDFYLNQVRNPQDLNQSTPAKDYLSSLFASPDALVKQLTTNIQGLQGEYQPLLDQQRQRALGQIQQKFIAANPLNRAQGGEFSELGDYLTQQSIPGERAFMADLARDFMSRQANAAGTVLSDDATVRGLKENRLMTSAGNLFADDTNLRNLLLARQQDAGNRLFDDESNLRNTLLARQMDAGQGLLDQDRFQQELQARGAFQNIQNQLGSAETILNTSKPDQLAAAMGQLGGMLLLQGAMNPGTSINNIVGGGTGVGQGGAGGQGGTAQAQGGAGGAGGAGGLSRETSGSGGFGGILGPAGVGSIGQLGSAGASIFGGAAVGSAVGTAIGKTNTSASTAKAAGGGAAAGAATGFAVGGPVGAAIGAVVGGLSAITGESSTRQKIKGESIKQEAAETSAARPAAIQSSTALQQDAEALTNTISSKQRALISGITQKANTPAVQQIVAQLQALAKDPGANGSWSGSDPESVVGWLMTNAYAPAKHWRDVGNVESNYGQLGSSERGKFGPAVESLNRDLSFYTKLKSLTEQLMQTVGA